MSQQGTSCVTSKSTKDASTSTYNIDCPPPSYEEVTATAISLKSPVHSSSSVGMFYPQVPPDVPSVQGTPPPYLMQLSPYAMIYHPSGSSNCNGASPPGFTSDSFTNPHIPHCNAPICVGVMPRREEDQDTKQRKLFQRCVLILIISFSIVVIVVMTIYHNSTH